MAGRQKTDNNLGRESPFRNPKHLICVIAEGKTEKDYLDGIKNNIRFNDVIIELMTVDKTVFDRDVSDRMNLVRYADDWRNLLSNGKCSLNRYVSIVLNAFYECYNHDEGILDGLKQLQIDLCNDCTINCSKYVNDDRVPYRSDLYKVIYSRCDEKFGSNKKLEDMSIPADLDRDSYSVKDIYIMFDRDYDEERRNNKTYVDLIAEIEKRNYHALVTTPQFELWLLMHFKGASFDGINYRTNHTTIENRLAQFDIDEYSNNKKLLSGERLKQYMDSIQTAIDTSLEPGRFETDPRKLVDGVGTNLGLFFKDVLGFRNPL